MCWGRAPSCPRRSEYRRACDRDARIRHRLVRGNRLRGQANRRIPGPRRRGRAGGTGLPLVAASAGAGTDYAALTGEPPFVRESIDLYHKQALDTGARIVHACGFDSIPSDLSVYALYRAVREDGAGELGDTNFVVRSFSGGLSGGTI